jgi:hypothetical protein
MTDIEHLLENRIDLEKLEKDVELVEKLLTEGTLGPDVQEQAREARQVLESARVAHTDLYMRLTSTAPMERAAARQELSRRIDAGELKIFDPESMRWRPSAELMLKAIHEGEALERMEVEQHQFEQSFQTAVNSPHNLKDLTQYIHRAEELERSQVLSIQGKEALQKAYLLLDEGLKLHRDLTLKIHHGTLTERKEALDSLKQLIAEGETRVMDAPDNQWRPSADILAIAESEYRLASDLQTTEILEQSGKLAGTDINTAIRNLYLAMDKKIPYTENDRRRLEIRYHDLIALKNHKINGSGGDEEIPTQMNASDLEGFKNVRELYQKKLQELFARSADWLNQFFRSALTKNSTNLLDEAEQDQTPVATAIERIDMAEGLARNALEGSIEIPEVMVCGAAILLKRGEVERARDLLARAKPLYTLERIDKVHRHAVTAWLLGCVEYYSGHRFAGYTEWKIARNNFNDLLAAAHHDKHAEKEKWYRARLVEIETQAIQTYEEVYFQWMNQFDTAPLTSGLFEYRRIMDSQLAKKQIPELKKTIQIALNISQREQLPETHWMVLVEVAFFEYQIRDLVGAIGHLNEAAIGFQTSHRGAVTLWLLGLIRWWLPSQRRTAMLNWESSIRIFQELSRQADYGNLQKKRIWYDNQISMMSASLKQWIALTQPRE